MKKSYNLKIYPNPRISAKMLGEYQTASAVRRQTIIKDSRIVPTYMVNKYNLATRVISEYLASVSLDLNGLREQIRDLRHTRYISKHQKETALHNIQALSSFLKHAERIAKGLQTYNIELAVNFTYHKFDLEGVEVSIRPELILKSQSTGEIIGFVKLYFSKSKQLDGSLSDTISCLGRNYFNEAYSLTLPEKSCFVLDVFTGELLTAPRAFKRKMSDIAASCREIADRWNSFN